MKAPQPRIRFISLVTLATLFGGLYSAWFAIAKPINGLLNEGQILTWMAWVTIRGLAIGWTTGVLLWLLLKWLRDGTILRWIRAAFRVARRIPLPTFPWAYACSASVVAAFAVWILVDSMFPMTLDMARYDVGFSDSGYVDFLAALISSTLHRADVLGPRILACKCLAILGLALFALTFLRFLAGRSRTSIRGWMLMVGLFAGWLGLWASYDELVWRGPQWRVVRELSRFEAAAGPLLKEWPTQHGRLPEAGGYYAYPLKRPDTILLHERRGYPLRESFGHSISRTSMGGLRYSLSSGVGTLEFHPPGAVPASYLDEYGREHRLLRLVRLNGSWCLTVYI